MKRIISLMLVLLMLTTCFLVSCTKDNGEGDQGAVTTDGDTVNEEKYLDELPEKDMGGYEFIVQNNNRADFKSDTAFGEDSDGSIYGEAIYKRNVLIEERFNCKLVADYNLAEGYLINMAMSGDCDIDLVLFTPVGRADVVLSGALLDWSEENVPYVDKSKSYYYQKFNENLNVGGSQFFLAGDFSNSVTRFSYCWYFNMDLLENSLHMTPDELYDLVTSKQWTYEKAYNMISEIYADAGTLGEKDTADTFGYVSNYWSAAVAYNYAFDNRAMIMVDGVPQMNPSFYDKSVDVVESVRKLFYDNPGSYVGDWGQETESWKSGNALFVASCLHDGLYYDDLSFDYGVIPYPMYDSDQKEYYSSVDGAHGLMAMLTCMPDERKENNSILIEALNAESARISKPVFIEQTLKLRTLNVLSDKANEVVGIILDSVIADFGFFFSNQIEGFPFMIQHVMISQSNSEENRVNFASLYEMYEEKNIKTYNDLISQLIEQAEESKK